VVYSRLSQDGQKAEGGGGHYGAAIRNAGPEFLPLQLLQPTEVIGRSGAQRSHVISVNTVLRALDLPVGYPELAQSACAG
jgi:hypothetical protein